MRALWPDRQNCSRNLSQEFKRIKRFSEIHCSVLTGTLAAVASGSVNRDFEPWLEIPDEAEVKLRLKRGKKEVEKRLNI